MGCSNSPKKAPPAQDFSNIAVIMPSPYFQLKGPIEEEPVTLEGLYLNTLDQEFSTSPKIIPSAAIIFEDKAFQHDNVNINLQWPKSASFTPTLAITFTGHILSLSEQQVFLTPGNPGKELKSVLEYYLVDLTGYRVLLHGQIQIKTFLELVPTIEVWTGHFQKVFQKAQKEALTELRVLGETN